MINRELFTQLTTDSGLDLHGRVWSADQTTLGLLVLVHGLGEHVGRYDRVATALNQVGITVAGFDLPGHGRSAGQRGHINHWQDYRHSLGQFLDLMKREFAKVPLFLMGHSLGAMIVLDFAMQDLMPLQGLVVSGAPLTPTGVKNPLKIWAARSLSSLLPRISVKTGLQPTDLSRAPELLNHHGQDALNHDVATLRWGAEMLGAIARVKACPEKIACPLLMIHGGCDPVSAVSGVQTFFETVTYPDKSLNIYPNSYHEPHNDLDASQVLADLTSWLKGKTIKTQQIT